MLGEVSKLVPETSEVVCLGDCLVFRKLLPDEAMAKLFGRGAPGWLKPYHLFPQS